MADLRHLLATYVHAHQTGNSVPPHIDAAARATLAAEPPAPAPADHVPDAGNMVVADGEREEREELARWLEFEADNAQELGCATIYDHDRLRWVAGYLRQLAPAPAPAADGEREELAQWLDHKGRGAWPCPDGFSAKAEEYEMFSGLTRAAALLREARPQPVPVAERPWERPGWCDARGRCWWFAPTEAISGGFRCAGWSLYAADPADEDTHCLPHWAIPIPQTPQGGEVEA